MVKSAYLSGQARVWGGQAVSPLASLGPWISAHHWQGRGIHWDRVIREWAPNVRVIRGPEDSLEVPLS